MIKHSKIVPRMCVACYLRQPEREGVIGEFSMAYGFNPVFQEGRAQVEKKSRGPKNQQQLQSSFIP